jgi:phosphoglycolate phosphatase
MTTRTLIFDLDGTISNPFHGIHNSVNYALSAFGHPRVAAEAFHTHIGPPIDQTFRHLLPDTDPDQVPALVTKFRERYAAGGYAENVLYADIPETLLELQARGYRLGVCTGKRVDFAMRILQMFELDGLFDFVDGGDVGILKQQQLAQLRATGTVPRDAVMIGDRDIDIVSARANDLEAVGVLWGFGSHSELAACAPSNIAERPTDLLELLR